MCRYGVNEVIIAERPEVSFDIITWEELSK